EAAPRTAVDLLVGVDGGVAAAGGDDVGRCSRTVCTGRPPGINPVGTGGGNAAGEGGRRADRFRSARVVVRAVVARRRGGGPPRPALGEPGACVVDRHDNGSGAARRVLGQAVVTLKA